MNYEKTVSVSISEGVYKLEEDMRFCVEHISRIISAFEQSLKAMTSALTVFYSTVIEVEDTEMKNMGTPPKKYGMSLRKYSRRAPIHYNYIPRAPRNLPYMRRTY